jgi:biotin synthase-related radical SAM superfamily protein
MPIYHNGHSRALDSTEVGNNTSVERDIHTVEEGAELLQEAVVVVHCSATYDPKSKHQQDLVEYLARVRPKPKLERLLTSTLQWQ